MEQEKIDSASSLEMKCQTHIYCIVEIELTVRRIQQIIIRTRFLPRNYVYTDKSIFVNW